LFVIKFKITNMKKLYTLSFLLAAGLSFGQATLPFTDTFSQTVGSNLGGQNGWVNVNTGDEIILGTGNLSYTGLMASQGNHVIFGGGGIDTQKEFTSQNAGTVYASFLLNIADIAGVTDPNGGYFLGLAETPTNFASTVWAKPSGAGFVLGLNKATAPADTQYGTTVYNLNTTYLVVIAYEFATNSSSMWVNPGSLGAGTAPAATLTANTGTDRPALTRFFIRQDSATETPADVKLDELRVGTTWASVTPGATAGINDNTISGLKMFPNPLSGNVLNITTDANATKAVAVYDVLGKQVINTVTANGTVNVSGLTAGIYIVKITEEGQTATRKLVVK
jgi:hypothetical protein